MPSNAVLGMILLIAGIGVITLMARGVWRDWKQSAPAPIPPSRPWPYVTGEELDEIFVTQYQPVYERGEDAEMFMRDVLAGVHGRLAPGQQWTLLAIVGERGSLAMPSSEATAKAKAVCPIKVHVRGTDGEVALIHPLICNGCGPIASALDEFAAAVVTGVAKSYKRMVDDELDARDAAVARAEAAEKETERLRRWVSDLQSGMYINCVYCGYQYGPRSEAPVSMADVLKAHVERCPEHPMNAARERAEAAEARVAELEAALAAVTIHPPDADGNVWLVLELPDDRGKAAIALKYPHVDVPPSIVQRVVEVWMKMRTAALAAPNVTEMPYQNECEHRGKHVCGPELPS